MLYERWREIAREHAHELALYNVGRDERWTFSQLDAHAETGAGSGPVAFPQGGDFIIALLRAWRAGQIVCPLEPDQPPPIIGRPPPEIVHLKTTSATSGAARFVAFTGEQLAADAQNIVETMGLRPDWANLGVISLAHSYGFSNLVLPLLLHGIPLILAETPLPEIVRRAANVVPAITLAAVPALWSVWHGAKAVPKNVRLAVSAGAPLSLELEQNVFRDAGLKIHNFYGSSECGGIAYDVSFSPRHDAACVGAPMRHVELCAGRDGCLEVRSRAAGESYWPEPKPNLGGGRFLTGDLVEIKDNLVYLRGRVDDQINVAGRKLFPEEIEYVLRLHPAVRECLVFGAPSVDSERTDIIVACIAAQEPVEAGVLKQFLLSRLPAWQIPREWLFVKSLETNQRGKLSRAAWRKRFQAKRGPEWPADYAE
jgi:acyl-CoA synthetase (AMP-forming)/AMP-acid ligase II